ncbi:MAG: hypothetical protein COB12_04640 [Flavobacterium sp.]|nr:MAG: hypothetical protein COB12_04640 [Flavobacterium sp.]
MSKRKRIILIITSVIVLTLIIVSLYANTFLENKVKNLLQTKIPDHIESNYKDIKIHSFRGSIGITEPSVIIKDKETGIITSIIKLDYLEIKNISYLDFYFNKEISLSEVLLDGLDITYFKDGVKKEKGKDSTKQNNFKNPISIKAFRIENASVKVIDTSKDSLLFSSTNVNFTLKKLKIDSTFSIKTFKDNYKSLKISADSIFLKSGLYENLTIGYFEHKDNSISITDLSLKTKYSKKTFSKKISKERDYYTINTATIILEELDYGFNEDEFYLNSSLININKAVASIYRNKLVADDFKVKNLYSKSIRELPIQLNVDSVSVKNSKVIYSERTKNDRPAGVLTISKIDASVSKLSNTYSSPNKTMILVDGVFMKNSTFHANWSFDISNKNDEFEFIGDIGNISGNSLNVLLTPLINARLEGEIEHTLFHIKGNNSSSTIYMSQKYEHVKIEILNNKKKKNKFVSGIANVFVHHKSDKKGVAYNHITANATRDNAKSFFNYLAKNLKSALLVSFFEKKNKKYIVEKEHINLEKYHSKKTN